MISRILLLLVLSIVLTACSIQQRGIKSPKQQSINSPYSLHALALQFAQED